MMIDHVLDPMVLHPCRIHRVWKETNDTFTLELEPTNGIEGLSFAAGQFNMVNVNKPVELTLKSVTKIVPHNFTLKDLDAGLNVDQNISPGKEVKVTFTSTKTGSYQFYCDKKSIFANHRKKGMEGLLEVKK